MRIIDAHTGRDVKVGDVLPIPGGSYQVVETTNPLTVALNELGYKLFGWGLSRPWIKVRSTEPTLDGQVIPLQVTWKHPAFPGQVVAFIPS